MQKRVAIKGDWQFEGAPHWTGMEQAFQKLGWEVMRIHPAEITPPADLRIAGSLSWLVNEEVCWMCDYTQYGPDVKCNYFVSNRDLAKKYDGHYLSQASLPRERIIRDNPNQDVVFIGTPNNQDELRPKFLQELKAKQYYHDNDNNKRKKLYQETPEIYGNAAICLGLDATRDNSLAFSNRLWNVLGSGGFYLTHYTKDMEELFGNHKHLVWFHSLEEAKELVDFYLPREKERRKIAEAGFKYVQANHTYECRIKELLSLL